ncbi:MAG: S41 family peptidase [Pirellulaceae bacterium]|nr:S41 family peptidase [Pirellulaceae bacterium]
MISILLVAWTLFAIDDPPAAPATSTSLRAIAAQRDYPARLDRVIAAVEERFYRNPLELPHYLTAKQSALAAVKECDDPLLFRDLVNRYLQSLNASHTYYSTPHDWEFYHLAAVFESLPDIQALFQHQPLAYPSIGVIVQQHNQRWIVADVLPGGPAADAGLLLGDVPLTVNGQPYSPVSVWWPLVDQPAKLVVDRAGRRVEIEITPRKWHPREELLAALKASISVVDRRGSKVAYAHFYSYAGRHYHDVLEQAIQSGELDDAAALVIDLRYGLGGADPSYLSLFNRQIPRLDSIDRAGQTTTFSTVWRKPVVLLINETSRSGKEVLAYGAKQQGLATLVGTRTAGAVLAGSPIVIDGEDLLYLAVRDVLVDGQRLEHVGVSPHVEVPLDLENCHGIDHQREAAFEEALKLLGNGANVPVPSS